MESDQFVYQGKSDSLIFTVRSKTELIKCTMFLYTSEMNSSRIRSGQHAKNEAQFKKNENETDPELKSYLTTMHYTLARTVKILMHKSRLRH